MEFSAILGLLKDLPDNISLVVVCAVMIVTFILKKKDVDLTQVTSISKLQTDQLKQLIDQNKLLADELHAVRKELTEAYSVINEMRDRIAELEDMVRIGNNIHLIEDEN